MLLFHEVLQMLHDRFQIEITENQILNAEFGCLISQLKTIHQGVMDVVKERDWDSNILGILTAAHPEKSKATCRNHHRVLEHYAFVA